MNDVRGVFSNASGMKSRHSTPQLQSIDKSWVWKLNWCPVPLNLHPDQVVAACLQIRSWSFYNACPSLCWAVMPLTRQWPRVYKLKCPETIRDNLIDVMPGLCEGEGARLGGFVWDIVYKSGPGRPGTRDNKYLNSTAPTNNKFIHCTFRICRSSTWRQARLEWTLKRL